MCSDTSKLHLKGVSGQTEIAFRYSAAIVECDPSLNKIECDRNESNFNSYVEGLIISDYLVVGQINFTKYG